LYGHPVHVGVVFPQTELGGDPGAARAYAQAAEGLGYHHVLIYDHVLGADPAAHPGWSGVYDVHDTFHEPLVLYGFLAAVCRLELVTGIIIMPQRQTALLAKQAAEVDLLTGGRFRLGVGVGWNAVEYEALGMDFRTRGDRADEQIELLRRLWTENVVTHTGPHDRVTGAGMAPLPVQRPIPIWIGAWTAPGFRRTGRLADGWFPSGSPGPKFQAALQIVEAAARKAGRDPADIDMEPRVSYAPGGQADLVARVDAWRAMDPSHLSINTMGAGLAGVDAHIAALAEAAAALSLTAP
jgi:probable F420-dependent oxidoreductase